MLPYMQQKDINMMDYFFDKYKPKSVLEWGCGGSTIYFPKKHDCIEWWYSMEHNLEWVTNLNGHLPKNVTVHYFSGDYVINMITKRILTFADFIIVDGVSRKACLEYAVEKCKDDALVFLHDSGRVDYHSWFDIFPYWKKLTDGRVPNEQKGGFKRDGLHVLSKSKITI